jgi:hypothetical protein
MAIDFPAELIGVLEGNARAISRLARQLERLLKRPSVMEHKIWEHVEGGCI